MRSPVVHFLLLGALLLGLYKLVAPRERAVMTAEVRAALRQDHERRTGAAPTPAEEEALVSRWLDEEAKVREARALGLDRDDPIVRRRLLQKMDFLLERVDEPDDAAVRAYFEAHKDKYAGPALIGIEHVFEGGKPFLRGHQFHAKTETEMAGIFGADFASKVFALKDGEWAEVRSVYGLHRVRVTERVARRPSTFDEAREMARRDLEDERKAASARVAVGELRKRWTR